MEIIDPRGITFIGILPDDPDDIPVQPHSGFIWMQGSAWNGSCEAYQITDVKISVGRKTLQFSLEIDDVINLVALLQNAIEQMKDSHEILERLTDDLSNDIGKGTP